MKIKKTAVLMVKIMKKTIEAIVKHSWHTGVRPDRNIFLFSLRVRGENREIRKHFGKKYLQNRLLIPTEKGVVRLIGLEPAKLFHERSRQEVMKSPEMLKKTIGQDYEIIDQLEIITEKLKSDKQFFQALKLLGRHYFLFFYAFSLGLQLFQCRVEVKNEKVAKQALSAHDTWRNAVAAREDRVFKKMKKYLSGRMRKLKFKNSSDINFLEISELEKLLRGQKITGLKRLIARRRKNFAFIAFKGKYLVVEDKKNIAHLGKTAIECYPPTGKALSGAVACAIGNKIVGKVMIIKNPKSVKRVQPGTILVAVQTTPDFIPIVKKFSAIITDEGGLTCHAAIISREFRIPCIIGARNATQVLKNGDEVEMDLKMGEIRIRRNKA